MFPSRRARPGEECGGWRPIAMFSRRVPVKMNGSCATSPIRPLTVIDIADKLKCPLLCLYGGKDTAIPVADIEEAVAKAKAAAVG